LVQKKKREKPRIPLVIMGVVSLNGLVSGGIER